MSADSNSLAIIEENSEDSAGLLITIPVGQRPLSFSDSEEVCKRS